MPRARSRRHRSLSRSLVAFSGAWRSIPVAGGGSAARTGRPVASGPRDRGRPVGGPRRSAGRGGCSDRSTAVRRHQVRNDGDGRGAGGSQALGPGSGTGGGVTRAAIPRGGYQVQPRYPTSARRQGAQGTTVLARLRRRRRRVTEVSVERTAGHADLDEAAAEAVRRWRFEPARSGDTPSPSGFSCPWSFASSDDHSIEPV